MHGDLASRLALQTILQAGGYAVDCVATPAEALFKLDEEKYDLVLTESGGGSKASGRKILAYARVKDYRPATALIRSYASDTNKRSSLGKRCLSVYTENLPNLLQDVAELIGIRASRRYRTASSYTA